MNVLFDFQTFSLQRFGGISRYFAECIRHMSDNDSLDVTPGLALYSTTNEYVAEAAQHPVFRKVKMKDNGDAVNLYRANKLFSLYKLLTARYQLFHPTYYDPYFLRFTGARPFVVTFHDMIHERFANRYPEVFGAHSLKIQKNLLAQKASRLIAVSEATKADVVNMLNIPAEKIDVVHLASNLDPHQWAPVPGLPEQYILFVGNRAIYKYFSDYLIAVADVFRAHPELHLVAAGGGRFNDDEQKLIHRLGLEKRILQMPFRTDAELVTLYRQALAFVFPSLYEGFGIPLLEAFSCQCPTISSNQGSLPEVGADAAAYFDPYRQGEAATVLEEVVTNVKLRQVLIERGLKRAKQFSWAKTTAAQVATYRKIVP